MQAAFNGSVNPIAMKEPGNRHMGGFHPVFNNLVNQYQTVVVMGFDADVCVRANLFGAPEYPADPVAGTSFITPLAAQADVVTSRALLVTVGTVGAAEYGVVRGL